jgi:hypothetical protein
MALAARWDAWALWAPLRLTRLLWWTTFCVVSALLLTGRAPAVSYGVYEAAGRHWLARQPLYEPHTLEGFQYFPQSAMVFAAFASLGRPMGGLVWRAAQWGAFASGLWRASGLLVPERREPCFLWTSLLAVGPAIGALTNGQANLALAAFTLHAVAELAERRWWRATSVLAFGAALKPLLLVLLLIAWALHRPLRRRMPAALAALFCVPWLSAEPGYVAAQYASCLQKMALSASAGPGYENLRGLLACVGGSFPSWTAWLAALSALGLCWYLQRRLQEPHASLGMAACGVSYLILFNPRTQSTSYAMIGAVAALLGVAHAAEGRRLRASVPLLLCLVWTVNYNWSGFAFIECWLKPLGAALFVVCLLADTFSPPLGWRSGESCRSPRARGRAALPATAVFEAGTGRRSH